MNPLPAFRAALRRCRENLDETAKNGVLLALEQQGRCIRTMCVYPKNTLSYQLADYSFEMCNLRIALWLLIAPGVKQPFSLDEVKRYIPTR